jgi:transglutaminase-like putative cysteine protease
MLIRFGFDICYKHDSATHMMLLLSPYPTIRYRLLHPESIQTEPNTPLHRFMDVYGNEAVRLLAPRGGIRLFYSAVLKDSGLPDRIDPYAEEWPVQELPDNVMAFLFGSRYCDVDLLVATAWQLFGDSVPGWDRVQAICEWVRNNVYSAVEYSQHSQTAFQTYLSLCGNDADLTHLAIAFCRAMSIPARYCSGYLTDISDTAHGAPADFHPWLVSTGRDANDTWPRISADNSVMHKFEIWAEEVKATDAELYDLLEGLDTPG